MTPLEKRISHILLDDDISDISLSKEDMAKAGVGIVSNTQMINFIRDCEELSS